MNDDIYEKIKLLGQVLITSNLALWAHKIEAIVQGGSTSTEIFMGVRWTLNQILEKEYLSDQLLIQIKEIKDECDRLLS